MRSHRSNSTRILTGLAVATVGVAVNVAGVTGPAGASVPRPAIPNAGGWLSVSAGGSHTCAINSSSRLFCWGANSDGELGTGDTAPRTLPTAVDSDLKWRSVSAGRFDTCAISTNDALWCWGGNADGQLGTGGSQSSDVPVRVDGAEWDLVTAGGQHTCGIQTDESLWCWGDDEDGQLGIGSTVSQPTPTPVDPSNTWLLVSAGGLHTCAVMDSHNRGSYDARTAIGSLWCWGDNEDGELGVGDFTNSSAPDQVGSAGNWLTVSAGGFHTCAIHQQSSDVGRSNASGFLDCWGYNLHGQLGLGTQTTQKFPNQVGSAKWTTVAAGNLHTCGTLTKGDTISCWGWDHFGQLGVGDIKDRHSPTAVETTLNGWGPVTAGDFHTCAMRDQTLWCWGGNTLGQLGLGDTQMRLEPAQVDPA